MSKYSDPKTKIANPRVVVDGVMLFVGDFKHPSSMTEDEAIESAVKVLPEVFERYPCPKGTGENARLLMAVRCLSAWARGLEMEKWRPEHHVSVEMERKITVRYLRHVGTDGLDKLFREFRYRHGKGGVR